MKLLPQLGVNGQKMRMKKVKSPTPRRSCWRGATEALLCPLLDLGSVPWAVWGSQGNHEQERKRFIRKPRWSWEEIDSCCNCTVLHAQGLIILPAHLFFLGNQRRLCPQNPQLAPLIRCPMNTFLHWSYYTVYYVGEVKISPFPSWFLWLVE